MKHLPKSTLREIKAACGQLANTYNKAKKQQK
jgi:adenine C2-methylase RlmN of 23S rRNA A2503 and tRNA A37